MIAIEISDTLLLNAFNSYLKDNIDKLTFVQQGKKVKICKFKVDQSSVFKSSLPPTSVECMFDVNGYYTASKMDEDGVMTSNSVSVQKSFTASGKAIITPNPNYKEGSHECNSKDKYTIEIVEITDKKIELQ